MKNATLSEHEWQILLHYLRAWTAHVREVDDKDESGDLDNNMLYMVNDALRLEGICKEIEHQLRSQE